MSLERKIKRLKKKAKARDDCKRYIDKDGNKVIPLSEEAVETLKEANQAFIDKFGREPGPGEPILFDPDFDVPTPFTEEKLTAKMVDAMRHAGIREVLIYAYEKTGVIVTEQNRHLIDPNDLAEYEAACAEFERERLDKLGGSALNYK
jgi:hypothetical protein